MARVRYYSPKRRAIYAAGEDFTHLEIFERDNWVCGICDGKIDPSCRQPSPFCATLDHVVPICEAVRLDWPLETIHTRDNVQAAHNWCNRNKAGHMVVIDMEI